MREGIQSTHTQDLVSLASLTLHCANRGVPGSSAGGFGTSLLQKTPLHPKHHSCSPNTWMVHPVPALDTHLNCCL